MAYKRLPLGHDESVYALRGHDLTFGSSYVSGPYWREYRAPGLSVVDSQLFRLFGENDFVARLPVLIFTLIMFIAVYKLSLHFFDERVAAISCVVLLLCKPLVASGGFLLADVPGSAISMVCIYIVAIQLKQGVSAPLYLSTVFIFGSLATFFRFGSFITYGTGLFALSIYFIASNFHNPKRLRLIGKHLLLQIVSLASFVWLYFTTVTSLTSMSPYQANQSLISSNAKTPLDGLSDLLSLVNPFSLESAWLNPIIGSVFIISIVYGCVSAIRHRQNQAIVICLLFAGVVSSLMIAIGVRQVVGNYLALTVPFWFVLSAIGIDNFVKFSRQQLNKFDSKVAMSAIAVAFLIYAPFSYYHAVDVSKTSVKEGVRSAGLDIKTENEGEGCVVITSYPQVAWYSKCLLGSWAGTNQTSQSTSVKPRNFDEYLQDSFALVIAEDSLQPRGYKSMADLNKYVVLVVDGKRQPSEQTINSGMTSLFDPTYIDNRVYYAKVRE